MDKRIAMVALLAAATLAACGGSGGKLTPPTGSSAFLTTPKSVSPALIKPAPMAKTAILPASDMASKHPAGQIQPLGWSQISGAATQVAAAADGSIWVLSTGPAGPDKNIWHYTGGTWTNVGGLASQIAIAPNGTLYAINSGGGTYAYSGGTWTGLGGGASWITAAADNSIYVLTNGSTGDRAIWHNVAGTWSQSPGSGVALYGSTDSGTYSVNGQTVSPGGFYVLNSIGAIYYANTDGSFAQLPGSASSIASTTYGGTFALGFPTDPNGNSLYYYDLSNGSWSVPGGSGVSISSSAGMLYVVAASGGIFETAVSAAATPTPTPSPTPTVAPTASPALAVSVEYPADGVGSVNDPTAGEVAGYTGGAYSQTLGAPVGTLMTVTNIDGAIPHTLNVVSTTGFPANPTMPTSSSGETALSPTYRSGNINPGASVQITLSTAGLYYFGCAYHYLSAPQMRDTINVGPAATPGPQATPIADATDPPCYGAYC